MRPDTKNNNKDRERYINRERDKQRERGKNKKRGKRVRQRYVHVGFPFCVFIGNVGEQITRQDIPRTVCKWGITCVFQSFSHVIQSRRKE